LAGHQSLVTGHFYGWIMANSFIKHILGRLFIVSFIALGFLIVNPAKVYSQPDPKDLFSYLPIEIPNDFPRDELKETSEALIKQGRNPFEIVGIMEIYVKVRPKLNMTDKPIADLLSYSIEKYQTAQNADNRAYSPLFNLVKATPGAKEIIQLLLNTQYSGYKPSPEDLKIISLIFTDPLLSYFYYKSANSRSLDHLYQYLSTILTPEQIAKVKREVSKGLSIEKAILDTNTSVPWELTSWTERMKNLKRDTRTSQLQPNDLKDILDQNPNLTPDTRRELTDYLLGKTDKMPNLGTDAGSLSAADWGKIIDGFIVNERLAIEVAKKASNSGVSSAYTDHVLIVENRSLESPIRVTPTGNDVRLLFVEMRNASNPIPADAEIQRAVSLGSLKFESLKSFISRLFVFFPDEYAMSTGTSFFKVDRSFRLWDEFAYIRSLFPEAIYKSNADMTGQASPEKTGKEADEKDQKQASEERQRKYERSLILKRITESGFEPEDFFRALRNPWQTFLKIVAVAAPEEMEMLGKFQNFEDFIAVTKASGGNGLLAFLSKAGKNIVNFLRLKPGSGDWPNREPNRLISNDIDAFINMLPMLDRFDGGYFWKSTREMVLRAIALAVINDCRRTGKSVTTDKLTNSSLLQKISTVLSPESKAASDLNAYIGEASGLAVNEIARARARIADRETVIRKVLGMTPYASLGAAYNRDPKNLFGDSDENSDPLAKQLAAKYQISDQEASFVAEELKAEIARLEKLNDSSSKAQLKELQEGISNLGQTELGLSSQEGRFAKFISESKNRYSRLEAINKQISDLKGQLKLSQDQDPTGTISKILDSIRKLKGEVLSHVLANQLSELESSLLQTVDSKTHEFSKSHEIKSVADYNAHLSLLAYKIEKCRQAILEQPPVAAYSDFNEAAAQLKGAIDRLANIFHPDTIFERLILGLIEGVSKAREKIFNNRKLVGSPTQLLNEFDDIRGNLSDMLSNKELAIFTRQIQEKVSFLAKIISEIDAFIKDGKLKEHNFEAELWNLQQARETLSAYPKNGHSDYAKTVSEALELAGKIFDSMVVEARMRDEFWAWETNGDFNKWKIRTAQTLTSIYEKLEKASDESQFADIAVLKHGLREDTETALKEEDPIAKIERLESLLKISREAATRYPLASGFDKLIQILETNISKTELALAKSGPKNEREERFILERILARLSEISGELYRRGMGNEVQRVEELKTYLGHDLMTGKFDYNSLLSEIRPVLATIADNSQSPELKAKIESTLQRILPKGPDTGEEDSRPIMGTSTGFYNDRVPIYGDVWMAFEENLKAINAALEYSTKLSIEQGRMYPNAKQIRVVVGSQNAEANLYTITRESYNAIFFRALESILGKPATAELYRAYNDFNEIAEIVARKYEAYTHKGMRDKWMENTKNAILTAQEYSLNDSLKKIFKGMSEEIVSELSSASFRPIIYGFLYEAMLLEALKSILPEATEKALASTDLHSNFTKRHAAWDLLLRLDGLYLDKAGEWEERLVNASPEEQVELISRMKKEIFELVETQKREFSKILADIRAEYLEEKLAGMQSKTETDKDQTGGGQYRREAVFEAGQEDSRQPKTEEDNSQSKPTDKSDTKQSETKPREASSGSFAASAINFTAIYPIYRMTVDILDGNGTQSPLTYFGEMLTPEFQTMLAAYHFGGIEADKYFDKKLIKALNDGKNITQGELVFYKTFAGLTASFIAVDIVFTRGLYRNYSFLHDDKLSGLEKALKLAVEFPKGGKLELLSSIAAFGGTNLAAGAVSKVLPQALARFAGARIITIGGTSLTPMGIVVGVAALIAAHYAQGIAKEINKELDIMTASELEEKITGKPSISELGWEYGVLPQAQFGGLLADGITKLKLYANEVIDDVANDDKYNNQVGGKSYYLAKLFETRADIVEGFYMRKLIEAQSALLKKWKEKEDYINRMAVGAYKLDLSSSMSQMAYNPEVAMGNLERQDLIRRADNLMKEAIANQWPKEKIEAVKNEERTKLFKDECPKIKRLKIEAMEPVGELTSSYAEWNIDAINSYANYGLSSSDRSVLEQNNDALVKLAIGLAAADIDCSF
jgi:hypothetical protein